MASGNCLEDDNSPVAPRCNKAGRAASRRGEVAFGNSHPDCCSRGNNAPATSATGRPRRGTSRRPAPAAAGRKRSPAHHRAVRHRMPSPRRSARGRQHRSRSDVSWPLSFCVVIPPRLFTAKGPSAVPGRRSTRLLGVEPGGGLRVIPARPAPVWPGPAVVGRSLSRGSASRRPTPCKPE